jgi:hypothetical protein
MPFGLDLKSVVITAIFILFVWPWITGFLSSRKSES